jgi:hypothetical protein
MRKWRELPMETTMRTGIGWLRTWKSRWLSKQLKSPVLEWK